MHGLKRRSFYREGVDPADHVRRSGIVSDGRRIDTAVIDRSRATRCTSGQAMPWVDLTSHRADAVLCEGDGCRRLSFVVDDTVGGNGWFRETDNPHLSANVDAPRRAWHPRRTLLIVAPLVTIAFVLVGGSVLKAIHDVRAERGEDERLALVCVSDAGSKAAALRVPCARAIARLAVPFALESCRRCLGVLGTYVATAPAYVVVSLIDAFLNVVSSVADRHGAFCIAIGVGLLLWLVRCRVAYRGLCGGAHHAIAPLDLFSPAASRALISFEDP